MKRQVDELDLKFREILSSVVESSNVKSIVDADADSQFAIRQETLIRDFLLGCRQIQDQFMDLEAMSSTKSIEQEVEDLNREIAEKDELMRSIREKLSKWIV